jgi:hypothetical protein
VRPTYWLTRFVFLRLLGAIYFVAFLSLSQQLLPLLGKNGILPAHVFLERVTESQGGPAFAELPSLFWLDCSDSFLSAAALAGLALSAAVALGLANAFMMAALWFLYMSFIHVGQIFYSYGWEILLLEIGFLAIFVCPLVDPRPFAARSPPQPVIFWLLRWVVFRVMFGAGLIKLRGDACWRDLTCLIYHYETQPLPNPQSWIIHQLPPWIHKGGVFWNHVIELVIPWFLFGPRRIAAVAGLLEISFQLLLILSGNLSWLNWLTLTACVACFDDRALARFLPPRLVARAQAAAEGAPDVRSRQVVGWVLAAGVVYLSIPVAANLLSAEQVMNSSFDRLHLVNTYGAFGSVGRTRNEVIVEGTYDAKPDANSQWLEYQFKCKPGDVLRRPCVVAPYQYRLDWQIWFAAMSSYPHQPWLVHLVYKLLKGDPGALALLAPSPFSRGPPRFIRARLFEYQFTRFGEPTAAWWKRRLIGEYLPPVSLDDPSLLQFLQQYGWEMEGR